MTRSYIFDKCTHETEDEQTKIITPHIEVKGGVGKHGDPCTETIVWSTVHYPFLSILPLVPYLL